MGQTLRLDVGEGLSPRTLDRLVREMTHMAESAGVAAKHRFPLSAVAEELCTNIMEHAQAHWLEIGLEVEEGRPILSVVDDGRSFDTGKAIGDLTHAPLDKITNRRLGLIMLRQLSESVAYERDPQGLNRLRVSLRLDLEES